MGALPTNTVIAVIGAGTMGAGIAQVAAKAGHSVLLYDAVAGAAQQGIERTAAGLQKLVQRNKISSADCEALLSRMQPCDAIEDLAPAKLVIEAIVERLEVKQQLFSQLENICSADTIFASNTSSISITAIGAALSRPQHLLGMHFFNPAPVMKLVEVISGVATDAGIAQQLFDTAAAWGKKPVLARSTPGFIVNRVARPFYAEALRVLEEGGADVATIDAIVRESGGFRMGPFELMDLIGHDVNYAVTNSVFDAYFQDPRFKPSLLQQELVNAGYLGRKSGRGFYHYGDTAEQSASQPQTASAQPAPTAIRYRGDLGVAKTLLAQAEKAGIAVSSAGHYHSPGIEIDGVRLALSDGRTATQCSAEDNHAELVLFDLALDYEQAQRIALTKSDQCSEQGLNKAIGFFQALGKSVSVIDDVPGMVLMRTVCMLANEGADAVNQQVCDAAAVDLAMQAGVNYPRGPLAWAEDIGLAWVVDSLDNIAAIYGEDRYRVSPLLCRKVYSSSRFFSDQPNDNE
ncbi:3-hydroxyacyl-CoA dehydrogenase PaaC [Dasania sp. GY-MA-18]|uniref:3-hydroxyacyl-CoA dehydrogenase PaaC n=1 Tax=Dasania phycosphaerae TaxID=2950436 RepID=A0A9J6RR03_9GAMM|nr:MULTISPECIES: 3-hydroxyacyl-CoA dehydrogenase PaaH [Dasania]MCR8924451.1 3-hydroxyacyl-CoA dehydrogenase PaaC [Dasania sp. GY-MA-18]MCZ0867126.1 3-hydroxyacyl-CoA dehydrogenase PaaC [Dasania phycosphaerae]MCZ0870578.1 3-hydroxyacyl-CoA dehydrogenase PaaC [Dasania phycosphaerae]